MWITLILNNWRLILAGLASLLILTLYTWGSAMKSERDEKIAEIDSMRLAAQAYETKSKGIADETSSAFAQLVEQIKDQDTALKNARARFGTCNVAGGVTRGLPAVSGDHSKADSTQGADVSSGERLVVTREFIDACALDAGTLSLWQQWAVKNELPIGD